MEFSLEDYEWMTLAIALAKTAACQGEVPVGAVVVYKGELIGQGFNQTVAHNDPTAHAEIIAIRAAAERLNNYRLPGCRLYVTLEPCLMCIGAIFHARIEHVIFGAWDPKTGACGSVLDACALTRLNHHASCRGGLMAETCGALLSDFFSAKRAAGRLNREQS